MSDTPNNNPGDEQISDETLMQYADGMLPPDEHAAVEAALAHGPALWERYESFRITRGPLAAAYNEVLTAPLTEKVLAFTRDSTPIPFRRGSSRPPGRGLFAMLSETVRTAVFSPAGAVATLLIGTTAGWLLHEPASDDLVRLGEYGLLSSSSLQRALETTPMNVSAAITQDLALKPTLTFRKTDENFCRQYELASGRGVRSAGIACREAGTWQILEQVLVTAPGPDPSRKKVEVATPPADVLDDLRDRIKEGDALDPAQEGALIKQHWETQTKP
jgi:hypothetical protein